MRYNGGKHSCAKEIASLMGRYPSGSTYWEPFVGAANVITRPELEKYRRFGSDLDPNITLLLNAVRDGWVPPEKVNEIEYAGALGQPPSALRAFIGYGCSFGGKFFGGFARSGERNYAANAKNSLAKQAPLLAPVRLVCAGYDSEPFGRPDIIYCDPPYAGATRCGSSAGFDSDSFWPWLRAKARAGTAAFVTEFSAPGDFVEIYRKNISDGLRKNGGSPMVERLFIHESSFPLWAMMA